MAERDGNAVSAAAGDAAKQDADLDAVEAPLRSGDQAVCLSARSLRQPAGGRPSGSTRRDDRTDGVRRFRFGPIHL
jgi:hypothetical protein